MMDFKKSVENEIKKKTNSEKKEAIIALWGSVFKWYEEGGEAKIKSEISSALKNIKEKFNEEHKKIENEIESI